MEILLFLLKCLLAYMLMPIVLVWVLFGVAWLKGWREPDITPLQILERLCESERH